MGVITEYGQELWLPSSTCHFVSRVAADALRILLARAQLDDVIKRLDEDNAWDVMKEPNTHIHGVALLARYVPLIRNLDK